jgi:hypothetical protein
MTMHGLPGRGAGNLDRIAYGPQHRVELLSARPKFDLIRRQLKHVHTPWPAIDAVKESKRPAAIRLISPEDSRKSWKAARLQRGSQTGRRILRMLRIFPRILRACFESAMSTPNLPTLLM